MNSARWNRVGAALLAAVVGGLVLSIPYTQLGSFVYHVRHGPASLAAMLLLAMTVETFAGLVVAYAIWEFDNDK